MHGNWLKKYCNPSFPVITLGVVTPSPHSQSLQNKDVAFSPWLTKGSFSKDWDVFFYSSRSEGWAWRLRNREDWETVEKINKPHPFSFFTWWKGESHLYGEGLLSTPLFTPYLMTTPILDGHALGTTLACEVKVHPTSDSILPILMGVSVEPLLPDV